MSEPVSRSVHQLVTNMLTILAQQGDLEAIAALERTDEIVDEIADDMDWVGEESEVTAQVIIDQVDGTYLVTAHGASFLPKFDLPPDRHSFDGEPPED